MVLNKYVPDAVNPVACSQEEAEMHLRGFAQSFIDGNNANRWIHFLIEKPAKSLANLHKFEHHLREEFCEGIGRNASTFPASLTNEFGTKLGVYFDGSEPPSKLSIGEAATLATERGVDAVFSLVAGKLAVFFHHADGVFICETK
jgi:hypothetical protein